MRPKPRGFSSLKAEAKVAAGLFNGRQMRSPAPVHRASPSESCTSGRQSTAVGFIVSENQYIELMGAVPKRLISLRRNTVAPSSLQTALPLRISNREAPAKLGTSTTP